MDVTTLSRNYSITDSVGGNLTNADFASRYAQIGLAVFPLDPGTKMPFRNTHGFNDATTDPEQVLRMWQEWPNADVAIVPHKSEGICLDWDGKNGGFRLLRQVERLLGEDVINRIPIVASGSGEHWHTCAPIGQRKYNIHSVRGLDVYGVGIREGYVVAPRSHHPDGLIYEWSSPPPWELPRPALMPELAELLEEISALYGRHSTLPIKDEPDLDADDTVSTEWSATLRNFDCDERFVRQWCALVDVHFQTGKQYSLFKSPLRTEKHPSAEVYRLADGRYVYRDFGMATGKPYFCSLAQAYGGWVTGRGRPLDAMKPVTFALWQTRMALELGWLVCPVTFSMERLPATAPSNAVIAYNGLWLCLQAHATFHGELKPVPYTYDFCTVWTGLKRREDAEAGIKWLKRNGFMQHIDSFKPAGRRETGRFLPRLLSNAQIGPPISVPPIIPQIPLSLSNLSYLGTKDGEIIRDVNGTTEREKGRPKI